MTLELESEEVKAKQIFEGITALILAPIVLPLAAGINNSLGKAALKNSIFVSEKVKEALAQTQEIIEDLVAEVQAELAAQPQTEINSTVTQSQLSNVKLPIAEDLINVISSFNEQVRQTTGGVVDLRLLVPAGLGALALRQILIKGLELDEIPWYTLAWYAFDTFVKLNEPE
ncbi:DUF5132 domain-containing protein [Chroococcidiopsis sp. CCALA 051]|uniref:DUF5132 domain-containing protein n=1 Tax=Chroococcidiopsis sp. CCALA 051 TaxID=869949 RepID=UPI000D0D66F8|nr:DUF5132 domain-containing protein [Chroococcidiopsis sp. CCALA 051]MBE9014774.1 DUF5132 domain-containing protein [Chroococcidiopsidales cyanobacterium LEGE 13417]PSM47090.1 DUF5132 domain-containing protein [Chroococcidiopsis sp. CCALA 051]